MTKKPVGRTGKASAKPAAETSSAKAGTKAPSEKSVKSSSTPLPKPTEAAVKAPDIKSVETKPGELKTPASAASAPASTPVPQAGGRSATFAAIVTIIILGMAGTGAWISRDQWWTYVAPLLPGAANSQSAEMMARVTAIEDHIARQPAEQDKDQGEGTESAVFAELQREHDKLTAELSAVMTRLEAVERLAGAVTIDGSSVTAEESIRKLADRLSTLEAGGNVDDGSAGRWSNVLERLQTVEDQTRAMESAAAEDTAALASLQSKIDAMESRPATAPAGTAGSSAAVLVLGVGQLRDATRRGSSYEKALDALSATMAASGDVAHAHTYLQTLRDHAASGVPTLMQLQRSFGDVADATFDASQPPGDGGWVSQTLHQLKSIVRIRDRDVLAKPGSVESRIARAENNLSAGDLAGAIQVLSSLDGAAATAVTSWLLSAESRLAVDDALTQLHIFAINRLMPGSAVPGPTVAEQE